MPLSFCTVLIYPCLSYQGVLKPSTGNRHATANTGRGRIGFCRRHTKYIVYQQMTKVRPLFIDYKPD